MSTGTRRHFGADDPLHRRARMLAAESVDTELAPGDAEWLAGHLGSCPGCAAVAEEYRAVHLELRGLSAPEPPRDLWARTSAALDGAEAARAGRSRGSARAVRATRAGRRPLISTAVAVGIVVVAAVASLIVQSPIASIPPGSTQSGAIAVGTASSGQPSGGPQAPLAVVDGTTYWMAASDGVYVIKGDSAQCAATDGSCTVANGTGQTLGSISSDSTVSAAIAPDASRAAVWTSDKVAIVPLGAQPQTVSLDQLTPQPTIAATPTAQPATPSPAAPTVLATASAAAPTASPSPSPSATPAASASATPAASASATPAASPSATASGAAPAVAILSGYEIVGRDPDFSPDGSLVAFSARPVDHSTGPDVFIWRTGDAQAQSVTSGHADLFAGWFGQQILISEISAGGSSAGATASASASAGASTSTSATATAGASEGASVTVSAGASAGATASAGSSAGASATPSSGSGTVGSTSYIFDPGTGTALEITRPMLLPVVDPTGQYVVYWSGTVEFDPVSGLWQPGTGDLYFDSWSDLTLVPASLGPIATPTETATPAASTTPAPPAAATTAPAATPMPSPVATDVPTAGPSSAATAGSNVAPATQNPAALSLPQLLPVAAAPGTVHDWLVRWDASGQDVAIWVADPGGTSVGGLSLFSIDRTVGLVQTNEPRLAADKVMASIAFDDDHLVYTSAVDGKTYLQTVPDVPPSNVSTPGPTLPGVGPTGAAASGSAAPQATDRPGN